MVNKPEEHDPESTGDEGFDLPPENANGAGHNDDGDDGMDEDAESEEFEEPNPDGASETAEDSDAGSYELADFDDSLLELHQSVESFLAQPRESDSGSQALAEDAYEGAGNVVGVGLGTEEGDLMSGAPPGTPALNVYVVEPTSGDDVRAALTNSMGISAASSDDVPINVIVTGPIEANSHRFRIRPAPGGVSIGHTKVTAGTLGCLARGKRGARRRRRMVLSNNHVIANSNNARFGDSITQPGRYDGGRSPRDRIAILERFVPINFRGKTNYVDCATGWAWPKRVRRELVYLSKGKRRFFRINSRITGCRRGMLVGKSGRTTQLTSGRVVDCNVSIRVNYGSGRVAVFKDQIAIRGNGGRAFSAGGDSGSVVWCWDRRRYPVGLLFAGGGGITFANKMWRVLHALDIRLET